MTTKITEEQRRQRIELAVKLLILGGVGFVAAPFVFIAIKGILGLAAAATLGLIAVNVAPLIATGLANWRLKMIKSEASKNPIETLQNDFMERQQALSRFLESIKSFTAEVMNYEDKLSGFKKQYPEEANKFQSQLDKMKQLLSVRKRNFKDAEKGLAAYALEIQKSDAIWQMGLAAAQMNKAAGINEEDFYARIKVETALDSVQKNLNSAFAELEISLLDEGKEVVSAGVIEAQEEVGATAPTKAREDFLQIKRS